MSFTTLSPEVLLLILGYLYPEDVVNLGKTCRIFRKLNKDRVLWRQIAYQMCYDNGALIPHDIDTMSLKELTHMATGPSRLIKMLHANRQPNNPREKHDKSRDIRVPSRVSKLFSFNDVAFQQMILVPGGRYMLTLALDNVFCFWDFRASPRKHPVCLKQWKHESEDVLLVTFVPTPDQRGFRVAIDDLADDPVITVYELSLKSDSIDIATFSAPFKVVPEAELEDDDSQCFVLVGNRLARLFGVLVTVWDYKLNKFASWIIGIPSDDERCREVILHGDRVWLLFEHKLFGWNIPEFRDLEAHLSQPTERIPVQFCVNLESPSPCYDEFLRDHEGLWISSQDWYSNLGTPLESFDVVWTHHCKPGDQITTYPLTALYADNLPQSIEPVSTLCLPISTAFVGSPRGTADYIIRCGHFSVKPLYSFPDCYQHIIVTPCQGKDVPPNLQPFRATFFFDVEYLKEPRHQSVDDLKLWMGSHVFDPISGRACMIKPDHSGTVVIWDYLDF